MQRKSAIWLPLIERFSISWYNFFASLILTTREIPLKYRLITYLSKIFPVFSPFIFRICIIDSLVNTLVFCYVNSCFLCFSTPSFDVSTLSAKNSSTFNIFFILYWKRNHMANNMSHKCNINATNNFYSNFLNRYPSLRCVTRYLRGHLLHPDILGQTLFLTAECLTSRQLFKGLFIFFINTTLKNFVVIFSSL